MKRLLLSAVLAIAALSTGCATAQTTSAADAAAPDTAVAGPLDPAKLVADLQNAEQISTAAGATQDASCYASQATWVQSVAASVTSPATAPLPAAIGPVGEFELARLKVQQVKTFDTAIKAAIVAGPPVAVHNACSPLWLDVKEDALKVAAMLGIANTALVPGVGAAALGLAGAVRASLPVITLP